MAKQDEKEAEERALPVVREGETWEDFPSDSDATRRLRVVIAGEEKVLVRNESTGVESEIRRDRFFPEPGGFRKLA